MRDDVKGEDGGVVFLSSFLLLAVLLAIGSRPATLDTATTATTAAATGTAKYLDRVLELPVSFLSSDLHLEACVPAV